MYMVTIGRMVPALPIDLGGLDGLDRPLDHYNRAL